MTSHRTYHLRCAECTFIFVPDTPFPRAAEVRAAAARWGWTTEGTEILRGPRDWCAVHGRPLADALAAGGSPRFIEHPCLCDARGQSHCLQCLGQGNWRRALHAAASALASRQVGDATLSVMARSLGSQFHATHIAHALSVLGWRP